MAEGFFRRYGDYVVPARYYECEAEFTVEQLYVAFLERLRREQPQPLKGAGQRIDADRMAVADLKRHTLHSNGHELWSDVELEPEKGYGEASLDFYIAADIDPLIDYMVEFVRVELDDDPTQDDPLCALHPIIEALRKLGKLP